MEQEKQNLVSVLIDGQEQQVAQGTLVLRAIEQHGGQVPTLCHVMGVTPRGACRICTVKINQRLQTACTTPVSEGAEIITNDEELTQLRKQIVEMMLAEGNHICPFCQKSGACELQDLAYQFGITVPSYPFVFPDRDVEASHPKLVKDHNRCILCKRCIRLIKDEEGKRLFAFRKRGAKLSIQIDTELAREMSDELAQQAVACCPVGAILPREGAYQTPIGKRRFDHKTEKEGL